MALKRRQFLTSAAVGSAALAASSLAKPAIAQEAPLEWKMVTSWPKGLPGLQTGAERLAQRIEQLSNGRIKVKVYAAGELVPALQVLDAVSSGAAEMGHDAAYYHIGKAPAAGRASRCRTPEGWPQDWRRRVGWPAVGAGSAPGPARRHRSNLRGASSIQAVQRRFPCLQPLVLKTPRRGAVASHSTN